ncbi:NADH-quinone oxidoreductase subunit N [groundwater metagenome]|uniref:NADH-quinone oxidoreductase subunit N n=1 Tax=groundwater metagenome TaxID=717931 RepID=A0A098E9V1_9ZZZZ
MLGLILPEIVIAVAAILILLTGFKFKKISGYIALLGIVASLISLFVIAIHSINTTADSTAVITIAEGISIFYNVGLLAVVFKFIFLIVGLMAVIASLKYTEKFIYFQIFDAYYALILFAILGMLVVASAADLLTLFVGLEMAAIPAYVLVAIEKTKKGIEGAAKYFLFGAVFSAILLFGISLIYFSTGSLMLDQIGTLYPGEDENLKLLTFIGILAIMLGLAYEMSAAPFHFWAPDAYQGAPSPVSALLAGASKKMAFVALLKISVVFMVLFKFELTVMLAILAILSMIVGNVLALAQKDVRRMLAYSSIAQVGYILAAIAIFTPLGIAYAIYYIIVHAFMKGGAFIAAGALLFVSDGKIKNYDDYKGLWRTAPITAFAMAAFMLSLAGIVPFGGFTAKILVLVELFVQAMENNIIALILGVVMIITSVISLYYYGRLIKYMWFVEPKGMEDISDKHGEQHGEHNEHNKNNEHNEHNKNNEHNEHIEVKFEKFKEPIAFVIPMLIAVIALLILFYAPPFVEICTNIVHSLGVS